MHKRFFIPQVFTMEIRRIFAYRVDFWIQFVGGALAQFLVAWFLWKAVFDYRQIDRIGAFTFRGMMLYYLLVPFVGRAVRGSEMGGMSEEIYLGTLNRYLVYPVSFFGFKYTVHLANMLLFLVQGLLTVTVFLLFFNVEGDLSLGPAHVFYALSAVFLASFLHFALVSLIQLTAFWADNVWSLVVIVRFLVGLLGGGMIPLSLFPKPLEAVLTRLPFAFFMSFPIRCLTGRVDFTAWIEAVMLMTAWLGVFLLLFATVWNRGKYQYTGVGI